MKAQWLVVLASLLVSVVCIAEEAAPPKQPAEKPSSADMVKRAREAKAKRKASVSKVITNADVKKAKAKLIVVAGPAAPETKTAAETPTSLETQEARRKQRLLAEETIGAMEKKVAGLERSVEELENQYYRENDPSYRDSVIRDRFNQARRQLNEARRELADARDAISSAQSAQNTTTP